MGIILQLQLSAFCNTYIEPTQENITTLMAKIKEVSDIDFLPNIVTLQNINIQHGPEPIAKIEPVPSIAFITTPKAAQITCFKERIDCGFKLEENNQDTASEKLILSINLLALIMRQYNIFSNRLALNVDFFSVPCTGKTRFEKEMIKFLPFYDNKELKEWGTRCNSAFSIKINDKTEDLNVITEMSKLIGEHSENPEIRETRILCHVDINTIVEKGDFRFNNNDIQSFGEEAKKIFDNIREGMEDMMLHD